MLLMFPNQNKVNWLEKVILKNLFGDEIKVTSRKLLGKEISLEINVGVWGDDKTIRDDIAKHITRGFADNWPNIQLNLTTCTSPCSFQYFQEFDVVVIESWGFVTNGYDLNQLLESGKGLVFFNSYPENCSPGFIHSCANGTGNQGYLTTPQTQHDMVKTLPNDPIFLNVIVFQQTLAPRHQSLLMELC
ncbi:hypothetical protein GEMRC1_009493 [Eukaryota sp. GEM-RC1]